jgi:hypothetical protein
VCGSAQPSFFLSADRVQEFMLPEIEEYAKWQVLQSFKIRQEYTYVYIRNIGPETGYPDVGNLRFFVVFLGSSRQMPRPLPSIPFPIHHIIGLYII